MDKNVRIDEFFVSSGGDRIFQKEFEQLSSVDHTCRRMSREREIILIKRIFPEKLVRVSSIRWMKVNGSSLPRGDQCSIGNWQSRDV